MHADEYRALVARQWLEKDLQEAILAYARPRSWLAYHTYDSRRSAAGFPDLVLVRGPRLICAELKKQNGRVTPDQEKWLDALRVLHGAWNDPLQGRGIVFEVHVWRPSDWLDNTVADVLQ